MEAVEQGAVRSWLVVFHPRRTRPFRPRIGVRGKLQRKAKQFLSTRLEITTSSFIRKIPRNDREKTKCKQSLE